MLELEREEFEQLGPSYETATEVFAGGARRRFRRLLTIRAYERLTAGETA